MVFQNPLFLFGLFAIAVPVIIHLFNFRRYRKIYFTNVKFLAAIRQETRKRSELKQLLILLSRILALTALVLAFARPYLPSPLQQSNPKGTGAIGIYIDNSFSMEAMAEEGNRLEAAREKALEIAGACQPSDQFFLATNDAENQTFQPLSRDEFTDQVKEVSISSSSIPLSTILLRQKEALDRTGGERRTIYIISDFQRVTSDISLFPADSVTSYILVPVQSGREKNLDLDSAWFDVPVQQPLQSAVLKVRIRNTGTERVEKVPVRLTLGGQPKAVASVAIDPGSETETSLTYTNGGGRFESGTIEIMDHPVTFDDKLYISYPLVNAFPVLAINGDAPSPYLNALYGSDSLFILTNAEAGRLDYSSLNRYRVVLLNGLKEISSGLAQELNRFAREGGQLVIFPPVPLSPETYDSFFSLCGLPPYGALDTAMRRVDGINLESDLFSDVFERNASGKVVLPPNTDLPAAFSHYRLGTTAGNPGEVLMRLENGDPFLAVYGCGAGRIYLFSTPLDPKATNLPRHPLFVPVMDRITLLSGRRMPLFRIAGQDIPIEITGDTLRGEGVYKLKRMDGNFEIIPEVRNTGTSVMLFPHGQVQESGIYSVERDGQQVDVAAFNYNRAESDPSLLSPDEITTMLKKDRIRYFALLKENKTPVSLQVRNLQQGTPLWKLFLMVTLIFIAAEIAIIRLMK